MPDKDYGFRRTECSCFNCSVLCRYMPGFLSPQDLDLIARRFASEAELLAWAAVHLRAGAGWVAEIGGRRVSVPSLVSARKADNKECHWHDSGRCLVHNDGKPYGCAAFDMHMPEGECQRRSLAPVYDVIERGEDCLYLRLCAALAVFGLTSPGPKESKRVMYAELGMSRLGG